MANHFIKVFTPLILSMLLGMIRVAAALMGGASGSQLKQMNALVQGQANEVRESSESYARRRGRALSELFYELPQGFCIAAFSYDTWVLTILFDPDSRSAALFYGIADKSAAILLLLMVHLILYIVVLIWTGVVRGHDEAKASAPLFENLIGILAIALCVGFQVYL